MFNFIFNSFNHKRNVMASKFNKGSENGYCLLPAVKHSSIVIIKNQDKYSIFFIILKELFS